MNVTELGIRKSAVVGYGFGKKYRSAYKLAAAETALAAATAYRHLYSRSFKSCEDCLLTLAGEFCAFAAVDDRHLICAFLYAVKAEG